MVSRLGHIFGGIEATIDEKSDAESDNDDGDTAAIATSSPKESPHQGQTY